MLNETNNRDEREYIEALMIDALDGNLSKSSERELDRFLQADPSLAEELKAMQAVDSLFGSPELVEPPAEFVQNTMAHLPNYPMRRWTAGFVGALMVILGLLPLAAGTYFFANMPAQSAVLEMTEAFLTGMAQIVTGLAGLAADQPLAFAVPIVMFGSIVLWFALYRKMVGSLIPARG